MPALPPATQTDRFWAALDQLTSQSAIRIDGPRGSAHPRFPDFIYPLDYGYLEGAQAADGNPIALWRGTLPADRVTAVICTVDLLKRDTEIKLLIGCSSQEAVLIERPAMP